MDLVLGARQFPNPNGIAPRMDTEGPPPTQFSGGAKLTNIPSANLSEQGDISSPPAAEVSPGMMREASAHSPAPEGNMVMRDAGASPPPDTAGLARPQTPHMAADPTLAPPSPERYHNTLRVFGDAKERATSQLLRSPDE